MLPGIMVPALFGSSAPTAYLVVTAPANVTAASWFSFTVQAKDAAGRNTPFYSGTVHFTSTSGGASFSADSKLTNGYGSFGAYFPAKGTFTVTATDTVKGSITGTSAAIVAASQFTNGSLTFGASQNWTVPVGFNPGNNVVEAYGAGAHPGSSAGGGGGGGAYSRKYHIPHTAGEVLPIAVGAGGGSWGATGGHSGILNPWSSAWLVLAYGGNGGGNSETANDETGTYSCYGGAGGNAANGVGDWRYWGGNGGHVLSGSTWGGGGGGCAGPSGNGGNGANGDLAFFGGANVGGGGGGGYAGGGGQGGYYYNGGTPGAAYGGGGGGPTIYNTGGPWYGAQGLVVITWYE
jgi:hypothetical protein